MIPKFLFSAALIALAACGTAPSSTQAQTPGSEQPFASAAVATFDAPWAMDFLPGSGLPLTNRALVTENGGRLWLVANRHLPYEALLSSTFRTLRTVAQEQGYKVIEAVKA